MTIAIKYKILIILQHSASRNVLNSIIWQYKKNNNPFFIINTKHRGQSLPYISALCLYKEPLTLKRYGNTVQSGFYQYTYI